MQKMTWPAAAFMVLYSICGIGILRAQQADHYTPESLLKQSEPLRAKAVASNGAASETLEKYGVDYTMLSFRSQDGGAELHENFADIFVVIDGSATLLTGGELVSPTSSGPGEMRGTSILHATSTTLAKGDVVHILPNTPHQLLIPKGTTLTYFVIKIKEKE
jgi:mannose-6-phosphate isomerase-like protein (cupin superfamily)